MRRVSIRRKKSSEVNNQILIGALPSRKCLPFSKAPAKCKAVFMMERSVFNEVKDYKP